MTKLEALACDLVTHLSEAAAAARAAVAAAAAAAATPAPILDVKSPL